jgi:MFS family permease
VICVLAADVTNLKNRGLAFAFTSSPYMITAFAGSKAAEGFLLNVNWRWGFGEFAIILPVVGSALFSVLRHAQTKALKSGLLVNAKSGRSITERIKWGIVQLDGKLTPVKCCAELTILVLGVVLFACGLTTFLLPFTLATSAPNGWQTDYIIAMLVVGFVLLFAFTLQQIYIAPVPFLDGRFLLDRTVIGACLINFTYQISYYCWNRYVSLLAPEKRHQSPNLSVVRRCS